MDINFSYGRQNIALGLIIEQLEAHWSVLQAELVEISRDLRRLGQMQLKYGQPTEQLIQHLRTLKQERKAQLKKIQGTMTRLDFDAAKGQKLLVDLEQSRQ